MAKQATKIQDCGVIDYVAGADIAVGDVVPLITMIGIAQTNIANGDTGALVTEGIFEAAAVTTAAFSVGDALYWDDTANKLTKTAAGNTPAGMAVAAKLQSGTTAKVAIGMALFSVAITQQAAVADIATADGSDATTTQALANATKAKVNALLASLRTAGIIASS